MYFDKRKIMSIVLAAVMLLLPGSVTAFADDLNYSWEIDENGKLTVSGEGELPFVWGGSHTPWENEAEKITELVVAEGITSLGDCAFDDLTYLRSASLPNSLKKIGMASFSGCKFLSDVNLPEKLETIGQSAFSDCSSLTELTIPESVTVMGGYVFSGCTSLQKVTFNCSLSALPQRCFEKCTNLTEITFPKGVAKIDGNCFSGCTSLEKITLPDTVTIFGYGVFSECSSLKTINTENILQYDIRTFEGCAALQTIALNETVKSVPDCMFLNSGITGLVLPENLEKIGSNAFGGCTKLAAINLPGKLTRLDGAAFLNCASLAEISIPKSITIISDNCFKGCTSLEKVMLHDDITYIYTGAFEDCTALKEVTLPKKITNLGQLSFANTGITSITIPKSLTTAGHGTGFYYNSPYESDKGPFGGSLLETASFEDGTTKIPDGLFEGAKKLKNVDLSGVEVIGKYAFANCVEFVPQITSKTTEIGDYAFAGCTAITDFEYPAWMEKIPNGLLCGTSIGCAVIPDTVKTIGVQAFSNCEKLSYIQFSATVTEIGDSAFYGCTALDEVDIPGNVISIGNFAFENCSNLAQLSMHKGTQTLGSSAFANCALTEVRPSQTIRELNDHMFTGNPVRLLVVPRFCKTWSGWGNYYNTFNPAVSYVPANVEEFDIYTYEGATILGAKGGAGEAEATAEKENSVSFVELTTKLDALSFDKDSVNISLDETYDAAAVVTAVPGYIEVFDDFKQTTVTKRDETDGELITFASSNEAVVTVDSTGYVHGVGYGTAKITISCDSGLTDELTVNVVRPSIGISISSGSEKMYVGNAVTLSADTIPAGYEENYAWSSSDEEIATVTAEGVVTAKKAGSAVISVSGEYSGKTARCVVTVAGEEPLPYQIGIDSFVIGCSVSLSDTEVGGNVIAALYDGDNRLIDSKTYAAAATVKADFTVSSAVDLTDAKIKVFWWNVEAVKPVANFRLVELQ